MSERSTMFLLIGFSLMLAAVSYYLSGQFVIAIALMIGLFPVIMSLSTRKY